MQLSEQLITVIILGTMTGSYLIGALSDFLNLKNLNHPMPEEFQGYYDSQKYKDSQNYLKATTRFDLITSGVDLLAVLVFWFLKGFQYTDELVRSLDLPFIITGLIFTVVLMFLKLIISLPFSVYSTFVIEEKFGFNKMTPGLFVIDLIKSIAVSSVLGGMLLALILFLLKSGGAYAWLFCWGASILFLVMVQYIVPTWIMPLFNKFTPLEEGTLKKAIFEYADSIKFSLSNIFVMDGSKRSSKSNAFFTGFGKNKRIVLYDTLIKEQTDEELVSVLAHEMGHFKKKHILKRLGMTILQMGIIFYLMNIFISHEGLFHAFFMEEVSIYAGLIFFGMLYSPIDFFLSFFLMASSRKDEFQADRFAAETLKESRSLISALKKLSSNNLSNLTPHPFYVLLNYSHPPVLDRIRALKATGF